MEFDSFISITLVYNEFQWYILEEERKRISEELSILNNIKHPNIISFINAWVSKNKSEVIFITEIVHGGSLKKYRNKLKLGI